MSNVISLRGDAAEVDGPDNQRSTDRRKAHAAALEALNLCRYPLVVFASDDVCLFANSAATEILGTLDPARLTTHDLAELVSNDEGRHVSFESRPFGGDTLQVATIRPSSDASREDLDAEANPLTVMQGLLEKNHSQRGQIEEISLQAEALADGSQAQSFVLDVMDSAVRRLQDSLLDMTSQAAMAKEQASQAMAAAATSQESVVESLKTMESMGASSKQIENLAQLLQGVAKQTSLLALNAAIEAARVGEDGRGFAVIADEIRQLSAKAKGAVTEVSALVQQTETWISEGVELSQLVDAGLKDISETASATLDEISGIHDSVEQQAREATKTYRAVHEVIDIAETNEVSADEIVGCCKDLTTITEEIIEVAEAPGLKGTDSAGQEPMQPSGSEIALD